MLIFFNSCANTSFLKEGERLYTGSEVVIEDTFITKSQKKLLEEELEEYIRPQPNSSLFGIKYKLWIWNIAGEPKKEKGLRHWLRNKLGEEPVLESDVRLQANNLILENQMFNKGFFKNTSEGEKIISKNNKKSKAKFTIISGPHYTFNEISPFPNDTSALSQLLASQVPNGYFKKGNSYNLDKIKEEFIRLGSIANINGYYFFNADYIHLFIDTNSTVPNSIDVRLEIKHNVIPPAAYQAFKINNVYIHSNHRNTTTSNSRKPEFKSTDSLKTDNFVIVDRRQSIREVVFEESIVYEKGDTYNESDQNKSLTRLVGTDLFKFVKSEYKVVKDSSLVQNSAFGYLYDNLLQRGLLKSRNPRLDVIYYLTQYPKKSTNLEIGTYTLNDSRVGSRLNVFWRNRNLFKGAEVFSLRGTGGFEVQYGGENRRPNTYSLGAKAQMSVPRYLLPFSDQLGRNSHFLPKTVFELDYNVYYRTGLYRINSLSTSLGYLWKEDISKEHKLYPINVTFVKTDTIANSSDLRYQNILFNGVIIGPTYEYIYNSQVKSNSPSQFYFSGLVDLSGNILGLAQKADYYSNQKEIFGNPYSQYIKLQTDFRYFYKINPSSNIATRLLLGAGIPYGNSIVLPNVKQFFAGGISSLRGFNARMLGPGTYNEKYLTGNSTYIEMLGDLKLEMNAEYRTQLYDMFHGALFVDAGNIWLKNPSPNFPGGHFTSNFYKELAVSAGLGLRIDISILLIRLDVGIPVRKPWLPDGERWVFNKIDIGDPVWRQQNIIFGFAIGYPF